ncbi:MAG: hypothetical protein H8E44_05150 [Planctomycetes bacterium]|nr:hypothetical protein [Planctomycetota bacterium]MBL7037289.1 hypothetical protein [Pirellulaceae bacterium]
MSRIVLLFGLLCLPPLFGSASTARSQEKASTDELPTALATLSIGSGEIVSVEEARTIRGAGGIIPSGQPLAPRPVQIKQVCIDGVAAGTVTIMEGMFAQFHYSDGCGIVVEGTFGGLEGWVGSVDGGLGFALQGKAYQETFEFAGHMTQSFVQSHFPGSHGY